jgi:hypothetical protein
MAELSDSDVFGGGTTAPSMLSDADVFGSGPKPQVQPVSDAQIFTPNNPGITDYLGEVGKRFVRDAVETQVALPLRGLASVPPDVFMEPDQMLQAAQERTARGQDPSMFKNNELGKVTENPLYTAGQSVSSAMNKALPDRNILNPVVSDVAGGFGSVAGNIATAMIPVAGPGLSVLSNLTGQGMGSQVDDAVKAGATEDQIRRAASLGQGAGATEFVDALLPAFLGSTGKSLGFIKRVGLRVAEAAFIEGGQEGLQQFIQNAIAKGIYAPKRDLMEDVPYNAMIGAIVGGGTGALLGGHGKEAPVTQPTAPIIDQSVAPPTLDPSMPQPGAPAITSPDPGLVVPQEPAPVTPPTVDEVKAKTLSPQIVEHIQNAAPPLQVPNTRLKFDDLLSPVEQPQQFRTLNTENAALKEEIQSAPGANTARLAKLLGPKLYGDPTDLTPVSVKEMFQNSFDAIKATLEQGKDTEGNIDVNMDPNADEFRSKTTALG